MTADRNDDERPGDEAGRPGDAGPDEGHVRTAPSRLENPGREDA